ncbi:hypothetical protein FRZ61_41470 [Hypericibacter adhaerens]|uniref:Uncharacterized protein n=1 Tax=Hypericibacter adhaerens TaxID=2602016 RepID=A0A5J6N9L6_9PROT|nr:hypothetical protein FRZ61_41470 [Hypericibacter adhaerens]
MSNWHDVEWRASRFHHQAFDDCDSNRTDSRFVSEAKANIERPLSSHRSERLQHYLWRIWYCAIVR